MNYGPTGPTGAVGPVGPPGISGPQGPQGPAAKWIQGSVEEIDNINLVPSVQVSEDSSSTEAQKIYSLDFTLQGPRALPGFTATCTSSQSSSNSVAVSKITVTGPQGILSETINFAFDLPVGPRGQQGPKGLTGPTGLTTTGATGDPGDPGTQGPIGSNGTGFETLSFGLNNIPLLRRGDTFGTVPPFINFQDDAEPLLFNESTQTLETNVLTSNDFSSVGLNFAVPQVGYTNQLTAYIATSQSGTLKIGTSPGETFLIHTFKAYTTCAFTISLHDSVNGFFNTISAIVYQNGQHGQGIKKTYEVDMPNPTSIIEDVQDNSIGKSVQLIFSTSDPRWNNNYLNYELILSPCMPFL